MDNKNRILLTGATGFVGEHVYPALVRAGFDVLCGSRDPARAREQHPNRKFCRFDLDDASSVRSALEQVRRAVYLAHSMADGGDYAQHERAHAALFRDAAEEHDLERIVYLGGMQPEGSCSRHLASRLRTGATLRAGATPTVELRATMIVGAGGESFRIVRDLAARLPWMVLPRWLRSESEPVAVADVATAIIHALTMPLSQSCIFDIPGPDRLSAKEMILRTARLMGHAPRAVEVPVVTPRLSSYWIRLVTRARPRVATELVEGLSSDILSRGPSLWTRMPSHVRTTFDQAVQQALDDEAQRLPPVTRVIEKAIHQLASA